MSGPLRRKQRAAGLSVLSNSVLVAAKMAAGLVTGSVAVISEAVHSGIDLLAAVIALAAVSLSGRPPDHSHPHGHGKIEDLSGAVEALLIFAAVVIIGYEAVDKLVNAGEVREPLWGMIVMGGSGAVNLGVSWYLQRVGRETDSSALLADAAHLRTDVYTSLGVLAGLGLVQLTGLHWLDPLVALAVGLLITVEAWQITRRSVGVLLDQSLPPDEQQRIRRVMEAEGLRYHALRSRKSGATRQLDLHLEVPPKTPADEVHALCDRVEARVRAVLPGTQLLIHPEPQPTLDPTVDLQERAQRVLMEHQSLDLSAGRVRVHQAGRATHLLLDLALPPETTAAELAQIIGHLRGHLRALAPELEVYVAVTPSPGAGGGGAGRG